MPVPSIPRHPSADRKQKNTRFVRRLARNQARWRNPLIENVFRRIECLAVHLDHVMKMRASGESAASDQSQHIAALDTLPFLHQSLGHMSVERLDAKAMIEL